MSIDLTHILDAVARKHWNETRGFGEYQPYDDLKPVTQLRIKEQLLPVVAQVAELAEETVRTLIEAQLYAALGNRSPESDSALRAGFVDALNVVLASRQ